MKVRFIHEDEPSKNSQVDMNELDLGVALVSLAKTNSSVTVKYFNMDKEILVHVRKLTAYEYIRKKEKERMQGKNNHQESEGKKCR